MHIGSIARNSSYFGVESLPILLGGLRCAGSEGSLIECVRDDWTLLECSESNIAGVECNGMKYVRLSYLRLIYRLLEVVELHVSPPPPFKLENFMNREKEHVPLKTTTKDRAVYALVAWQAMQF